VIGLMQAGLFLAAAALLVRWLDRVCRRAPLIELTRFPGNDEALRSYQRRMDAAGEAPVRNVREVQP
jgi:hypothetical protein